ncbi:hypothetical protein ES288_D06G207600v1 [Gossypium darwinii]|uniref:Uncharacterized protein n=1 Tax=Gossypium darwinii TaxID=34276 RepID=A0A5D2CBX4_GOSDA|nr:hypothetical protein ES288_D06G207600v1 [Gossypium darwinii]
MNSYRKTFSKTWWFSLPLYSSASASPPHLCSLASPHHICLVISVGRPLSSLYFEETLKN